MTSLQKGIAMFRIPNAIQVKAVYDPSKKDGTTPNNHYPTPEEFADYATTVGYWSKQAAKGVAVIYIGKKVVDVAADLAHLAAATRIAQ
jgi:hypothetical protein